ncbi:MAG: DNA processing protein, partial [Gammaproteobacteria bacterium]
LQCLLALLRTPTLGPRTLRKLLQTVVYPASVFELPRQDLEKFGLKPEAISYVRDPDWLLVENDLRWLEEEGNHVITFASQYYPNLLKQIHDPPVALYVKGNLEVLSSIQLGIVGSRNPTADGRRLARDFAKQLAALGLTITSGLALGIDSSSHMGALDSGGRTIAVLGNGLHRVYPASNKKLAESVLKCGALVSELPLDYPPIPSNFPRRNRIISGMSTGVLVVEAALRSGSLITARCAIEQGRDVFAIPGSIHNPLARGCHSLIREGAKLVEQIQDITEEFGPMAAAVGAIDNQSTQTQQSSKGLDAEAKVLLDSIGYQPVSVDFLVEATGFTVDIISISLLKLELSDLVESSPGGNYIRKS